MATGKAVFGIWIRIPHPMVVEAIASAGSDFIHFDQEHGPIGKAEPDQLNLVAGASVIPAIVRLPGKDGTVFGSGGDGGIVPMR